MSRSSQSVQQSKGFPPGLGFYSPAPFAGMNTQASPVSIADSEFLWLENFLRLGDGNLRTAWDAGAPFYTAPTGLTIVMFYFYTIGTSYYCALFLSDGSAEQLDMSSGVATQIGPAGTFYSGTDLPSCAQWGTLYLLISNRNTVNDYWAWDGSILYSAGTAAPDGVDLLASGSKYTSVPTVTAFGGEGSGMVIVPTVDRGGVVNLEITNPGTGYQVGDIVQLAFSGGGSDTSAQLVANIDSGAVTAVGITAPGSEYTSATVAFSGGGGSGAAGTVQIGSGVNAITVTAPGTGYTDANVSFSGGGGTGAAATPNVEGGQVVSIDIDNSGSGYTSAPTLTINGDGTGATATATIQNGIVTGVTITNPGSGYTSAPTVTITGDGTGATAQAFLNPGGVDAVTVVNGGSGFTFAPAISFIGGGGTGATGVANLTPTNVARIDITDGGSGYEAVPDVKFTANPGASLPQGTAVLDQGQIVAVDLTDGGGNITTNVYVYFDTGFTGSAKKGTLQVGKGSGATAQAILSPTSIASVTVSSSGRQYTTAPAVEVQPGSNNSAYATVNLMPFGVSGSALETYQQRVWASNPAPPKYGDLPPGGDFQVSAAGSITDFATSDGGVQFTNSDGFLQTRYVAMRQSNGYLYAFGDGSISIISSINTSGDPATTTFNYQNVDPQVGMSWRDSHQDFGKTILFGNETGVYGLYGGTATLASAKLNDIFNNAIFPPTANALTPTSASATLFDVKHFLMLCTILDPDTQQYRNVMLTWNERDWCITSQTVALTYIGTQKVSSRLTAWGTDGRSLYPLFETPSMLLTKRMDTKLYGSTAAGIVTVKDLRYFWMQGQDRSTGGTGIDCNVTLVTSGVAVPPDFPELAEDTSHILPSAIVNQPSFKASPPFWPVFGTQATGTPFFAIGARLTTLSPDFVMSNLTLGYVEQFGFL